MQISEMFLTRLNELGVIVPGVNTTVDVSPGETRRQAAKFGNIVTDAGLPPLIKSNGEIPPIARKLQPR